MANRRRVGMLAVLGVAAAFMVASCGGGGGESGGGGGGGGGEAPTVKIVSDLPLQGSNRGQTETMVNAIRLALEQRDNKAGEVNIEYQSLDDSTAQAGQWDEAKCSQNAQSVASDEEVVGWLGPFNSGCASVEIPILNEAGVAMISAANTAVGLTKPGGEPGEPDKYYPTGQRNYARVVPADDKQGRAGATFLAEQGAQSVFIIDDRQVYGQGLADQFQTAAEEAGIEILGREGIDGKAPNYRALMTTIAEAQPDAIYFGGITQNNAGQLIKDKVGAGMSNEDVLFVGPDGITEAAFIEAGGEQAEGVYTTFGGLPPEELPEKGQQFLQAYEEKYGGEVEPYTAYAYESANVMLDAIQRAYEADGEVTREGVVREVLATKNYDGVLGKWSFDETGDITLSAFTIFRVENGDFVFDQTLQAE